MALIDELRLIAKDAPDSNFVFEETPHAPGGGGPDGSNKIFRLQRQHIVTGSVYLTQNTTFRTQTGFTMDYPNGVMTFTAAPQSTDKIYVDYNFELFADSYYTEFLSKAASLLNYTDPTLVPTGLVPALLHYALSYFHQARSTEYASKYASSTGGMGGHSVSDVTKAFARLAEDAARLAQTYRDDYYKRQGAREAPASGVISYGIDPYTPRR